jgi:N-acetylated-alpha-linked acidic dipeptidase
LNGVIRFIDLCGLATLAILCAASFLEHTAAAQEQPNGDQSIAGFSQTTAAQERVLERAFDARLRRENLQAWMKRLTAKPHHLGSAADKENAEFIAGQFRSWGYQTVIERFDVLFPTPKTRLLQMTAPVEFSAKLEEPALKEDATSGLTGSLPPYNVYSVDGDVTAELVYVNYGVPKDYETLAENGVEVKGKIVIARYGASWRGIKPKVAAEHGAIGCILYSDPKDDGYYQGDAYPKGAWRNADSAQRGSVSDMPLYPGDPLTPGEGAVKDAQRLPIKDAPTLTKIPVLPISYADALPLLRALDNGPVAPDDFRGALPITYHLGPGPATVHLQVAFDWQLVPAYDVIATLPGTELADEWIIRGNHHDAWVFGAEDPVSGTVALMEEARALSELHKDGWKPRRSIVFAAWDGEEPGLLGSTEWAETHAALLQEKAAVYVNSDYNGRGFLDAGGSHTLEKFVDEISQEVLDPEKKIPVSERLRAHRILNGTPDEKRDARNRGELRIGALGSGSDYSAFLQHLGIASLDIHYAGENQGGVYHSIYDSYDHFVRFRDPGFDYGIALAQTTGRAVLRLANAEVLPCSFLNLTDTLSTYISEVEKLADDLRERARERNRLLSDHTLAVNSDPARPYVLPRPEAAVPYLNFSPLDNGLLRLQESARNYQGVLARLQRDGLVVPLPTRKKLDAILIKTERAMISEAGLPRRPWYKHQIYAPGAYAGYRAKTLPGVREAIESWRWSEADQQISVTAQAFERVASEIDRAVTLLGGSRQP